MLKSVARGLASGIFGQGVIANALLESFAIHARALLDFLYSDPRRDDVIAEDFFSSQEEWRTRRPEKPDDLKQVASRVGKEIAHLTYARQLVTKETKPWAFLNISNAFDAVLGVFLTSVPKGLLGQSWQGKMAPTGGTGQGRVPTSGTTVPFVDMIEL